MMALTDVDMINAGLNRFAGGAIAALDEDSDLAEQTVQLYRDVVDSAFSAYLWTWARRTRSCERADEEIQNGYAYAFSLPAGMIGQPIAVLVDPRDPERPLRQFAIEGRTLYCDFEKIWVSGIYRFEPEAWPPLFRHAVTTWLASEFCVPVTHDKDLAERLRISAIGTPAEQMRGGLMGRAISVDASGGGSIPAANTEDPITAAWHGDF